MEKGDIEEDKLQISYHVPDFPYPVEHQTIMEYFSRSPFWDREESCSNATFKMQNNLILMPFPSAKQPFYKVSGIYEEPFQPANMKNQPDVLEYDVLEPVENGNMEPIWVIVKQRREDKENVVSEAYFYIINRTIYQAPDMASVLNSRMLNMLFNVQEAFEEVQKFKEFYPSKGYAWKPLEGEKKEGPGREDKGKQETVSSRALSHELNNLFNITFHKYLPPGMAHLAPPPPATPAAPPSQPSTPAPARDDEPDAEGLKRTSSGIVPPAKRMRP